MRMFGRAIVMLMNRNRCKTPARMSSDRGVRLPFSSTALDSSAESRGEEMSTGKAVRIVRVVGMDHDQRPSHPGRLLPELVDVCVIDERAARGGVKRASKESAGAMMGDAREAFPLKPATPSK